MKTCYIYGLYDASDVSKTIRYVGKTVYSIDKRLSRHISDAKRLYRESSKLSNKNKWILDRLSNNVDIRVCLLETVEQTSWQNKEIYWISKFDNLLNVAPGGFGGCGKLYKLSYSSCKEIVSKFKINSKSQWLNLISTNKLPNVVPKSPREVYLGNGWVSWMDFLGSDNINSIDVSKKYILYEEASLWIKNNIIIESVEDWKQKVKNGDIPYFIPNKPYRYYNKLNRGWKSWSDFLNNNNISNNKVTFVTYKEAKKLAIESNIIYKDNWRIEYKKLDSVPSNPWYYYKEWTTWKNFININE